MPVIEVRKKIGDVFVSLIKSAGDIVYNTVDVTRIATAHAIQSMKGARRQTPYIAGQAVRSAIQTGYEAGAEIGILTKDTVIGVIQGVSDVTKVTPGIMSVISRAAVRETKELGGDITLTARKAVEGAIEAGKQAGLKAEDAASAGAMGAISAASELGEATTNAVIKALSGTFNGIRIVLESPLKKNNVLIINTNRRDLDLLSQQLNKEGYRTYKATNDKELIDILQSTEQTMSVALVYISDFDQTIWDYCDELRKAKIPFLVISSKRSLTIQQESIKHGADGVLIQPFSVKELTEHIRSLSGN